jgi:subtilase family serine protease
MSLTLWHSPSRKTSPVISISYGICESLMSAAELNQGSSLFEEAAAQGQTLVAAAGDGGSTPCASYPSSTGITPAQQQALSVIYPADSPYVTAVGGTQMAAGTFAPGSSQYWATASNIDSVSSLFSYVPEVVWNEGSTFHDIVAGGGGASSFFPRPAWQNSAPGIPSGTFRLLPDIALQSSVDSPGFLVCSDDPNLIYAQGHISSCLQQPIGSSNPYTVAGGTSFAAPIFAGFVAILNQVEHTTGQGNINPILYNLASNPKSYAAIFHDITSGTNTCLPSVADCPTTGQSEYAAMPGYDEATGLGSVDFGKLVAAWPSSSAMNLIATNVLLTPSKKSASPGDSVPIQIVVGSLYSPSGNAVPTGTVSVSVDGSVVQPSLAFSSTNVSEYYASTTYNFLVPATVGSHLVTVAYPGDATHTPPLALAPS